MSLDLAQYYWNVMTSFTPGPFDQVDNVKDLRAFGPLGSECPRWFEAVVANLVTQPDEYQLLIYQNQMMVSSLPKKFLARLVDVARGAGDIKHGISRALRSFGKKPFLKRSAIFSSAPVRPGWDYTSNIFPDWFVEQLSLYSVDVWVTLRMVCKEFLSNVAPYKILFERHAVAVEEKMIPDVYNLCFITDRGVVRAPPPRHAHHTPTVLHLDRYGNWKATYRDGTRVVYDDDETRWFHGFDEVGDGVGVPPGLKFPEVTRSLEDIHLFWPGLPVIISRDRLLRTHTITVNKIVQGLTSPLVATPELERLYWLDRIQISGRLREVVYSLLKKGPEKLGFYNRIVIPHITTLAELQSLVRPRHTSALFRLADPSTFAAVLTWLYEVTNVRDVYYGSSENYELTCDAQPTIPDPETDLPEDVTVQDWAVHIEEEDPQARRQWYWD